VVEEAIDALDDATPICGWKFGGRSMRFLKLSVYRGVSLSIGGATRSQSQDCANTFGVSHPAGGSTSPTCSRLDKIWRIHTDVPPYTDNAHGAGSMARFAPVVLSGRFREHGWVTPNPNFESCGYAKRRSAARSAAK